MKLIDYKGREWIYIGNDTYQYKNYKVEIKEKRNYAYPKDAFLLKLNDKVKLLNIEGNNREV